MPRLQLSPRVLSIGLTLTIVFLAGFAIFTARSTQIRAEAVEQADQLATAFLDARYAMGAEESLERKYRLEPGPDILQLHRNAALAFVAALQRAEVVGDEGDGRVADSIIVDHARYLEATAAMFAAVDTGDAALATEIDTQRIDPIFDAIQQRVFAEADEHEAAAAGGLAQLRANEQWVFVATTAVFALGFGFVLLFWQLLGRYRRSAGDAQARQLADAHLSEERLRLLIHNTTDVIAILTVDGRVTYASPAAERLWQTLPPDRRLLSLVHPDDVSVARAQFVQSVATVGLTVRTEFRIADREGGWRTYEVAGTNLTDRPSVAGIVVIFHDITANRAYEAQLSQLAFYDQLTRLPNRALVLDRLGQALARRTRHSGPVAVLFLDLDNFKVINDSLGHAIGDRVLAEVGSRITSCIRTVDTAARLGGDEFLVVLDSVSGPDEASQVGQRIAEALRVPLQIGSHELFLDVSTGIALAADRDDPGALIRKADLAMYRAKTQGKGRSSSFDEDMDRSVKERLELETDLRHAVDRGELRVHYQPIVALADGSVRGLEALVRWQHPTRGLVPPLVFIGIAEGTGLIVPIGQWVLEEGLRQLAEWGGRVADLTLSVNLSARQFRNPRLVEDVANALAASGIRPDRLNLEITESVVMEDADEAIRLLEALRGLGIHLAIDDFGTGYSSLAYLGRLPVDTLKIDRAFVKEITRASRTEADLLRGIIALARTLDLKVIAEGVETEAQRRLLESFGCTLGQGYLFAKPASAPSIESLLPARRLARGRLVEATPA